jgi:hypothetical protein
MRNWIDLMEDVSQGGSVSPSYMEGFCHVYALAINKIMGFQILLLTDSREKYSRGIGFPNIPSVVHVYAVDGSKIYDFAGSYDLANVSAQWRDVAPACRTKIIKTAEGLSPYVCSSLNDWTRPLEYYSENDLNSAISLVEKRFLKSDQTEQATDA